MQWIWAPQHLQQGIQKLYEQVSCKIRQIDGFLESFISNMGVKQGCPWSPTLFGLYIDELEELITEYIKIEEIEVPTSECTHFLSCSMRMML